MCCRSGFSKTVAPKAAHLLAKLKFKHANADVDVAIQVNMAQVISGVLFNVVTVLYNIESHSN